MYTHGNYLDYTCKRQKARSESTGQEFESETKNTSHHPLAHFSYEVEIQRLKRIRGAVVMGIAKKSGVGNHERRITNIPEG